MVVSIQRPLPLPTQLTPIQHLRKLLLSVPMEPLHFQPPPQMGYKERGVQRQIITQRLPTLSNQIQEYVPTRQP